MKKAILAAIVLLLASRAFCKEILVSGPYPIAQVKTDVVRDSGTIIVTPTIQAAIDAAVEGDTIMVYPGIYHENLQWDVNNITLTSTNPNDPEIIASTVIDGNSLSDTSTVQFTWPIPKGLLTGFTITGGYEGISGNEESEPLVTISHCVIRNNHRGITGINGTISNCLIYHNNFNGVGYFGGLIINCAVVDNAWCGVVPAWLNTTRITNCIIWGNGEGQIYDNGELPVITYSCVQGGYVGEGNTDKDPCFVDAANRDYRLREGSPCIDAGRNTWPVLMPATDLGGNFRQIDGDGDGIVVVDMGAYEYGTATGPIVSAQPEDIIFTAFEGNSPPGPQNLYISNIGPGTLNWTITENCPWLSVLPLSGSSAGETTEVTVAVDTAGLSVGIHACNLVISDSTGDSRAVVQIHCAILAEGLPGILNVPSGYPTIQAAIDAAATGDTVLIAPGIYTGEGNHDIYFRGKAITVRSVDPNDRWTVDNTAIDCSGESPREYPAGFILASGEDVNSVLDGLTITNGNYGVYCGGNGPTIKNCNIVNNATGILSYSDYGSPSVRLTIANCRVRENYQTGIVCDGTIATIIGCDISRNRISNDNWWWEDGGGIYVAPYVPPDYEFGEEVPIEMRTTNIIDCNISDNVAGTERRPCNGGGIMARGDFVVIDNCRILNNRAAEGGGVYNFNHTIKIRRSVIAGNAAQSGGAVCVNGGRLDISDSIVSANLSQSNGGGFYSVYSGGVGVQRCTIASNVAGGSGGGVCANGFSAANSIFWGNSDSSGNGAYSQILANNYSVSSSCIQDDNPDDANIPFGGEEKGNIDDDPRFVRMSYSDDYGDLHLKIDSPCIDVGSPLYKGLNTTDIDNQPRVIGRAVDMGADEYGKMIVVTRPKAGEIWATGSKRKIQWTQNGISDVNILLSADNGASWETIAGNITGTNYLWAIPDDIESNQCVISVIPGNGDTNVICRESGLFTISWYPAQPAVPPELQHKGWLPGPDLSQNKGPQLGCIKWVFDTNGPVSSQVAVTRPYWNSYGVYIGCEDGNIYALDDLGELIWSHDINTPIVGSPAAGYYWMVYVAGQNGWLYAIDDYGDVRWTQTTNAPIYATPVVGYDGKIYVCSEDGFIYAFDANGSDLWKFAITGPGTPKRTILATPVIERNGAVYVAGLYEPNLYALDANSGSVKWVCDIGAVEPNKGQIVAPPAIGHDGTIYQTLVGDPNLYAIDPCTGNIIWSTSLRLGPDTNSSGWSSPAIGPDGTIYISFDDPYLRAIRPDGTIKWITRLGAVGGFTLTIDRDGFIYAASDDGYVCVVNADGLEVSRFKGVGWVSFPAITEDGTLFVSDSNNRVWAITETPCEEQPPALHWPADIQPSWKVDVMDFALLANNWLECTNPNDASCVAGYGMYAPGDINRNMYVDFTDFAAMADKWLMESY